VKHINSVLEKIHDYNISAYMRGGGNHEKTFQSHMENIKSQCKDALAKVSSLIVFYDYSPGPTAKMPNSLPSSQTSIMVKKADVISTQSRKQTAAASSI
jgi:hypothetical protein